MSSFEIVVVGSLNVDVTVDVPQAPEAGQTLLGGDARRSGGGKGGNQAVAAARLGRSTAMVGAVGASDGEFLLSLLRGENIDISGVRQVEAPTGQAFVFVDTEGDSTIVVSPGANDHVEVDRELVAAARCVLLQQEVPAAVVEEAASVANGIVVLNPAPARPVAPSLLANVDVLVPNRGELLGLAGGVDRGDLVQLAQNLGTRGPVVVTLGAQGCLVVEAERSTRVPAEQVKAVDATAAGDSFCAAIADALLDGADIVEAARWATRVAAVTVTRQGAMASLPTKDELA
ncbi:ribokinase [Cryptosporangium aurantiacum]|uniref:Ribokinase n=1 Tax=Cryptosporangium aurantiacum TaxID=134849 RepID=A0A1M7MIZ7_9ACTN|nr:ribokinase [Cryptosporangium aurantiacum]SHM90922.1 ribokinase [Cryptosporangium aurantiacum]